MKNKNIRDNAEKNPKETLNSLLYDLDGFEYWWEGINLKRGNTKVSACVRQGFVTKCQLLAVFFKVDY